VKSIRKGPAKVAQFLGLYGGSAEALAMQLRIALEEAEAIMRAKNEAFPQAYEWQQRMLAEVVTAGRVREPMGRLRHGQFTNTWKDRHEARGLVNFIIQGGSASQIKTVLNRIWLEKLLDSTLHPCYFYFSVHDSVVFAVHKDDLLEFAKKVHPIMCQRYADFDVDFKSTIDVGPSFGETVEIGEEIDEEAINNLIQKFTGVVDGRQ
jgi:DNA polymerase I-like protein with 3'-5' exonuclease and polymerase domains